MARDNADNQIEIAMAGGIEPLVKLPRSGQNSPQNEQGQLLGTYARGALSTYPTPTAIPTPTPTPTPTTTPAPTPTPTPNPNPNPN